VIHGHHRQRFVARGDLTLVRKLVGEGWSWRVRRRAGHRGGRAVAVGFDVDKRQELLRDDRRLRYYLRLTAAESAGTSRWSVAPTAKESTPTLRQVRNKRQPNFAIIMPHNHRMLKANISFKDYSGCPALSNLPCTNS